MYIEIYELKHMKLTIFDVLEINERNMQGIFTVYIIILGIKRTEALFPIVEKI